ncbi:MAG: DUF4159 domain-containing protein [Acidobacteriota bacterium]
MRFRVGLTIGLFMLAAGGILLAQRPFKEWPAYEYGNFAIPADGLTPHEWVRARLRYPDTTGYPGNSIQLGRYGEPFEGYWTMDYPRSDRHLLQGVRRLTRIDASSLEQVTALDQTDDIYNWPMLYGVEVGHWDLPQDQADQLREYLLRGGFLMVDDFHADEEWATFLDSLERVFPDRQPVDIPDNDPIFHTVYDLQDRVQIPGAQYLQTGRIYEKDESGRPPHWRAIYDDKGRIMVAICHNMDLGDAWEWSDSPEYPEKWAGLAYRIGMNYFVYDLTH